MEDEAQPAKNLAVRLPVDFIKWFQEIAKEQGLTAQDAAREALLEWGRNRWRTKKKD